MKRRPKYLVWRYIGGPLRLERWDGGLGRNTLNKGPGQHPSDIPAILDALKKLFKAKGLRYQDVADMLKVSKVSVKRYLSGHGLTLETLEALCSILELRLADITEIAQSSRIDSENLLSQFHEEALSANPFLVIIFVLLTRGWSPTQLQTEFDIGVSQMNAYLTLLDKIGLIELHPFNRIKFLIPKAFRVKIGGPLQRLFDKYGKGHLYDLDIAAPNVIWRYNYYKLSEASVYSFTKMLDEFLTAVDQLEVGDRNLPRETTTWQNILFLAAPIDLRAIRTETEGATQVNPGPPMVRT